MNTNTTPESFTREAIVRAFARRAVTMYLNGGGHSRSTFLRLDGLAEGLTILEIVMTPFAFVDILQSVIVRSGGVPVLTSSGRAAWIESVVDTVTTEVLA